MEQSVLDLVCKATVVAIHTRGAFDFHLPYGTGGMSVIIITHEHTIASLTAVLNQFILKLDNRYDKNKKPGTGSTVKRERVTGLPSTSQPPPSLPAWMIDPNYKLPTTIMMTDPSEVPEETASECIH